jgi:hypothetical protein
VAQQEFEFFELPRHKMYQQKCGQTKSRRHYRRVKYHGRIATLENTDKFDSSVDIAHKGSRTKAGLASFTRYFAHSRLAFGSIAGDADFQVLIKDQCSMY